MSQLSNVQREALGLALSAYPGVKTVELEQMGHHTLVRMTGLSGAKLAYAIINASAPGGVALRNLTLWGGKVTTAGRIETYTIAVSDNGVSDETRLIDLTFAKAIANAKA